MRSMKAMKAAKAPMRRMKRAKKVSKVGRKWQVLKGTKVKTVGGLNKTDLTKNKAGKVVSKKASAAGKRNKWIIAANKARKALGIKGFAVIGGNTAQGKAYLAK